MEENVNNKLNELSARLKANNSGISAISLLGVAFVVLKLLGVINWSWWWVTAPFWIPATIAVILVIAVIVLIMHEEIDGDIPEEINYSQNNTFDVTESE